MTTYRIERIADILAVPPEHLDECMEDLRNAIDTIRPILELATSLGDTSTAREMWPHMDFTPDGKGSVGMSIHARDHA